MSEIFVVAIVFFGFFNLLRVLTDYLLRRRIVKDGHVEKAGILESPLIKTAQEDPEPRRYTTLKWALVAFFGGVGVIIADILKHSPRLSWAMSHDAMIPFGIVLVFISFGFIIHFIIVSRKEA